MVNVEADVLAGPLLAQKAREAGIIYSMAYGDQPALIAEMVDWARTAGFDVVCAGKGTKHLPQYHDSTPDTVWDNYGFTKEQLATGDFTPQMFNSFLDGTKSSLEMAAVANGSPGDYQKDCFKQYGLETDETGRYAAQFKPYHLIGLELGISIATIMCRGEPTGQTKTWEADVVATAKRHLKAGEKLDGEGGFTVWGKLMPARDSLDFEGLPIGLAHGFVLKKDIEKGQPLSWNDVEYDEKAQAVAVRREMERLFR
ncbi:putative saf domain-containing protein [Neofusicoccum parvum]|nr:putative saf domain-containing protein [Neofusicoccum parvum]